MRETHNVLQLPVFFLLLRETHNALQYLCSSSLSSPSRSSALSEISGNLGQKTILQTTEQLIQFRILEFQFRSLKYMAVIRIRKKSEQHSISIQAIAAGPKQC